MKNNSRGFTLIETAIMLAIASVIVAGTLSAYRVRIVQEKRNLTLERVDLIRQAMVKFQSKAGNTNKNLPCPAPRHVAPGASNFGIEDVAATYTCGTTPVGSLNDTTRVSGVRIGMVPVTTLGLPAEDSFDSWGRRLLYVVSEDHATGSGTLYSATTGAITLLDASNASLGATPFVIVSMGKNGAGGVTYGGPNFVVPCSDAGTQEQENCDGDATFHEGLYSESGGATNFDDYIVHNFDNIGAGGGGTLEYIDDLKDGISNYNDVSPTGTNVFLGQGAGSDSTPSPGVASIAPSGSPTCTPTLPTTMAEFMTCTWAGHYNTGTGIDALTHNTTGEKNTANGYLALSSNTTGFENTAGGAYAMRLNETGSYNTADGAWASYSNISGSYNTATGARALALNTASNNTADGYSALQSNTTGSRNTAVGTLALTSNQAGYESTAVGYFAMYYADNTTNTLNTAVGAMALAGGSATPANNTGVANTAVGYGALVFNISGNANTAIGGMALYSNTSGNANTATGAGALYYNTTGNANTATGGLALQANTAGNANTATGTRALSNNTIGSANTANGMDALWSNVSNHENTAIGFRAMTLFHNPSIPGTYNTAVGALTLGADYAGNNSGTSNTAAGHSALYNNTTGSLNTAVGVNALYTNSTGYGNTAAGWEALQNNTTGAANTAAGREALKNNTTGAANTAVGGLALNGNTITSSNTAVGNLALYKSGAGLQSVGNGGNTAIGWAALSFNVGGSYNTAAGWRAMSGVTVPESTILTTAYLNSTTDYSNGNEYNTAVGAFASHSNGGTTNTTLIGYDTHVAYSNTVQIGNSAVLEVHLGAASSTVTAHAGSVALASDSRLKKDIQDSDLGLDFVEKLRPVSYRFKSGGGALRYGFIAQEVEKTLGARMTGMVTRQADKMKTYGLSYNDLIAPIVRAIHEIMAIFHGQDKIIQERQAILEKRQEQIQSLLWSVDDLQRQIKKLQAEKNGK